MANCTMGLFGEDFDPVFSQRSPKQSHGAIRFSTNPVTRGTVLSNWPTTGSSLRGIVFVVPRPPFTRGRLDRFRFLGNCPPTPPLRQRLSLGET